MRKTSLLLLSAFLLSYFEYSIPLSNGQQLLANQQFEQAKAAFNQQDYFEAECLANMARQNAPEAAAPWILIGNCFYLQGEDSYALFDYSTALRLDSHIGHLPPFWEQLRREGPRTRVALNLTPSQLASLRAKIGQMIMVSVPGVKLSGQKKMMLRAGWIGGVILFDQNVQSKNQVAQYIEQLQLNSPTPLFVALDQEGGAVRRLRETQGFQRLPSLAALGQTKNPKLAYRFGLLSGQQLKEIGANLNLAPVVDIDHGLDDPIISKYNRSLGADPELVSTLALQIIRGMKAQNILATAKHFPNQSLATVNPHEGVAESDVPLGSLEALDLIPYRNLIRHHLLDAVMLSHVVYKNVDPYFPASLSPEMIQTILRGELGYQGLVISDDLRMDAVKQRFPLDLSVVQAVNAGVDILLVTDNYERRVMDSLVKAVLSGGVPMKKIDLAYRRIMATKAKYGILALKKRNSSNSLALKKNQEGTASSSPSAPLQLVQKPTP